MSKFLVIVESPAKSATIGGYLGPDYEVLSSLGHVRDLAAKSPLGGGMSVDPDDGWTASYAISPDHKDVVAKLKKAAKDADAVYLATDRDREGEAIAWHLAEVLTVGRKKLDLKSFRRVVFNEITRDAIRSSFSDPGEINMQLVEAQWSRRFLDRVVGYRLSPLLWKKNLRGASAGRVQSVALRLLVERERAIRAFVPKERWEVQALLEIGGKEVEFQLTRHKGKPFQASSEEEIKKHLQVLKPLLEDAPAVSERDDRPLSPRPGAPFITASLQRAASSRLSMGIRRTMQLAQSLYEAGLITYMRTDSTHLSDEAVDTVRKQIAGQFPPAGEDNYLPDKPRRYASRAGAQESHEAIRPTRIDCPADRLPGSVDSAARRLYDLIYRRFLACQMANSRLLNTRLRVEVGDYVLEAKGRVTLFDGFLRIWPEGAGPDKALPQVEVGTKTQFKDLNATRKFTQPPRRYNEADLVRELEKRGIGRPSTYADIVSTLQKRGYARLEKKRFVIERLGEVVCMRLEDSFPELMNYGFTADMEKRLDGVASGKIHWRALLDEFYKGFRERLEQAADPESGMKSLRQILTEIECTECSRPMSLRLGSSGLFLGCSGYRRKDEKDDSGEESCKSTQNLAEVARIVPGQQEESQTTEGDSKGAAEPEIILPRQCERCGQSALVFQLDQARRLWVCGRSPDCDWTQVEHGNFAASAASVAATKLAIHLKDLPSRKYPDDYYILREGRNGLFLAAAGWPKHKEARNILVSELPLAGGQLGDKYAYLLSAPAVDPQDRPTEVCFSRKSKTQYIRTAELEKGQTGWTAFYDNKNASWKAMAPGKPASGSKASTGKKTTRKATASKAKAVRGGKKTAKSTKTRARKDTST